MLMPFAHFSLSKEKLEKIIIYFFVLENNKTTVTHTSFLLSNLNKINQYGAIEFFEIR